MKRSLLLWFLPFLPIWGAEGDPVQPEAFLEELQDAYRSLNAFQAQYLIDVPTFSGVLTFTHNPHLFFSSMVLKKTDEKEPPVLVLVEYGGSDLKQGDLQMTMGEGSEYQRMVFSEKELFSEPPALLHGLLFLSSQVLREKEKTKIPKIGDEKISSVMNLGLEENQLSMGFGFKNSSTGPTADWLAAEWYEDAEEILLTERFITVHFPKEHIVRIQRQSGLIEKDTWPKTEERKAIHITLLRFKELDPFFSIAQALPGYGKMKIKAVSETPYVLKLMTSMALQLNEELKSTVNFTTLLQKDPLSTRARIFKEARSEFREFAQKSVQHYDGKDIISKALIEMHGQYLENAPPQSDKMSIDLFFDTFLSLAATDPGSYLMPPWIEDMEKRTQEQTLFLRRLPLPPDAPLWELHDRYGPVLRDALSLELISATVEEAKRYHQASMLLKRPEKKK